MPITTTNHDDYKTYDDSNESIDVPSELNDLTNPSPTSLRIESQDCVGAEGCVGADCRCCCSSSLERADRVRVSTEKKPLFPYS